MKNTIIVFLLVFALSSCGDKSEDAITKDSTVRPTFYTDRDSFVAEVKAMTNSTAVAFLTDIKVKENKNVTNLQLKIAQPKMRSDNDNLLRVQGARILGLCNKQISNLKSYDSLYVVLDKSVKNGFIERNEVITLKYELKENSSK